MGKVTTIKHKITAWTAIFAVLLMVLAPTISRALSTERTGSGSTFWMEICSAFDDKVADLSASSDQSDGSDGSYLGAGQHASSAHCPYCLMHADVLTPPRKTALNETVFRISHLLPQLFYRAPQPLFAWTVAASRGPPARS